MTSAVIQFAGTDFLIEGVFQPFHPGCNYLANGDPGYPDEPAEFEIESVFLIDEATGLAGSVSIKDVFEGMILERARMRVLDLFEAMAITKIRETEHD